MLLPVGNIPLKVSYDQAIGILLKDTRIFILLVSIFFLSKLILLKLLYCPSPYVI